MIKVVFPERLAPEERIRSIELHEDKKSIGEFSSSPSQLS